MKKLLSAAIALTIGATCAAGLLAGCGKDDSKAANEAIQYIRLLYEGDPTNTTNSFTVSSVAVGGGKNCNVSWSVSMPDGYEVKDYFTFSNADEDGMITVYVSRGETDVEYTLTATAKVGKKTASYSFKHNLVGLGKIYTTAEIAALDQTKSVSIKSGNYTNKYYSTDGSTAAVVAVRGYIVDVGSWSDQYNNFTNVYINDTYTEESNKNSTGALQVYRLKTDEVYITGKDDVERGTRVTLQGCIQFYNGSPELTYQGSTDCTCIGMTKVVKTDSQRVSDALTGVPSTLTIAETGPYILPTSSDSRVSFAWAIKSGNAATLSGSTLNVASIPSGGATMVLTLTASCGSVSTPKDVTVTFIKAEGQAASISLSSNATRTSQNANEQIWTQNGITLTNTKGGSSSDVGNYAPIRLYKSSNVKIEYTSNIYVIVFNCNDYNDSYAAALEESLASCDGTVSVDGLKVTVIFNSPVTSIEFVCSAQIRLNSIDINPGA